jgi:two-component system NtrC family sensor kinase
MGIFTLFLFAVAIVVVMVLLATKRITDPLRTLVRAAQDLPHTDVLVSTPQSVITEFHDLISSFNEMAHSVTSAKRTLEEKLQELQTANQSIRNAQGQLIQSAKMAGLGQLVAGVAHELNNPIGFIHANMFHLEDYCRSLLKYVEILEEKYPNPSEREKLEIDFIKKDLFDLIRSCQDGAKRTKDIVQGLKTFSRIDETSMKQTDINEGIQSTLKMLKSEPKGATLDLQLADNLPKPLVYASLINQVWMNLILNAAHALPTVGGKILIKTLAEGDVVSVKISDNGSGIHPNDMDKIFEPFFTTKDVGKGTGLGLSICYNVIEKHGGHISVASKVNQGTTFHVTLPLRPPQSQTA